MLSITSCVKMIAVPAALAQERIQPARGQWREVWWEDWGWGWERDGVVHLRTTQIRYGFFSRPSALKAGRVKWRLWVSWCVEDGLWVRTEAWRRDDRIWDHDPWLPWWER